MKKFLLVTFIGMVLAINVYGIAKDFINWIIEEDPIETSYTIVYEE